MPKQLQDILTRYMYLSGSMSEQIGKNGTFRWEDMWHQLTQKRELAKTRWPGPFVSHFGMWLCQGLCTHPTQNTRPFKQEEGKKENKIPHFVFCEQLMWVFFIFCTHFVAFFIYPLKILRLFPWTTYWKVPSSPSCKRGLLEACPKPTASQCPVLQEYVVTQKPKEGHTKHAAKSAVLVLGRPTFLTFHSVCVCVVLYARVLFFCEVNNNKNAKEYLCLSLLR